MSDTVEDRTAEFAAVHATVFGESSHGINGQRPVQTTPPLRGLDLDDEHVIGIACPAKNGAAFERLLTGDVSGYTSQSEADLAFLSITLRFTRRATRPRWTACFAQAA